MRAMVIILKLRTVSSGLVASALLAAGLLTGASAQKVQPSVDVSASAIQIAASEATSRFVPLGIGKSVVVDLPRDVKDVLVADPKIANAVVRTSRRAYIIGVAVGQTSVVFFDAEGRQIAGLDIAITRDLNGVRAALRHIFPESDIRIDGVGDGVVLTGTVANASESQQAFDIAARLVGTNDKVVNGITIRGRDQVMLKVTVAEVQRDVTKQLGIDLSGRLGTGTAVVNFNTQNPFPSAPISSTSILAGFDTNLGRVEATIRAMERAGIVRTLAEPNLSAISGETANFLAGGEFPVITGSTCNPPGSFNCTASVEFKKFGVSLGFTPIVLSEGRISLKVITEVSELSTEGALVSQGGVTIPSLKVRRADTTLEIPSGGSLAMAGLISEQTKQTINGLPGMEQLPVLGALFRSRDYVNRQTELMVLVTPYIVRAVAQKDLSRPDDGFADASDPSTVLLGRLNRIYGIQGSVDPRKLYRGSYGFILD
jgi:pilus assembly protein CpaC